MLDHPPRETPWLSWLYALIWSLIIFATIPFARAIQKYLSQQWGRDVFTYGVLSAIGITLVVSVICVLRYRSISRSSYFWLATVAAIFIGYTLELGRENPGEAIHFIQYGVLGVLVYRALTHRIHDVSIYCAAAIICGIIGIIDEVIQWLTPDRYWVLRDIWINFFSAGLIQISIAKGLKPRFIAGYPHSAKLRFLLKIGRGPRA